MLVKSCRPASFVVLLTAKNIEHTTHPHTHTHMHTHTLTHAHACTHTHTHAHAHTQTHAHTHTHTHLSLQSGIHLQARQKAVAPGVVGPAVTGASLPRHCAGVSCSLQGSYGGRVEEEEGDGG